MKSDSLGGCLTGWTAAAIVVLSLAVVIGLFHDRLLLDKSGRETMHKLDVIADAISALEHGGRLEGIDTLKGLAAKADQSGVIVPSRINYEIDEWGNPFILLRHVNGDLTTWVVFSSGPDGAFDGGLHDDLIASVVMRTGEKPRTFKNYKR